MREIGRLNANVRKQFYRSKVSISVIYETVTKDLNKLYYFMIWNLLYAILVHLKAQFLVCRHQYCYGRLVHNKFVATGIAYGFSLSPPIQVTNKFSDFTVSMFPRTWLDCKISSQDMYRLSLVHNKNIHETFKSHN